MFGAFRVARVRVDRVRELLSGDFSASPNPKP